MWKSYDKEFQTEYDVYKFCRKSFETQEIKDADLRRDDAFRVVKLATEAAALSHNPEIKNAGVRLQIILDNYKNSYKKPYTENTALITNLIQDLEKPVNSTLLELINLTEAVEVLAANNETFKNIYDERSVELYGKQLIGTMATIRPRVDKAHDEFMDGVEALYVSNELVGKNAELRALLTNIIDTINSYISQMERVYARRAGGKNGKKKTDNGDDSYLTETVPHLVMIDQQVIGESEQMSGCATQTTAKAADPAAFAEALYPIATGGVVRLRNESEDWEDFSIAGFLMNEDNSQPVGLILDPPSPNMFFCKPLSLANNEPGEVLINGELLATIEGIGYPTYVSEG
ncbi:MAG: DUF6261 family protein [Tannerellaceae bacterium]|nr:DUF6261 family protein [Tannerellaceae bacterium]